MGLSMAANVTAATSSSRWSRRPPAAASLTSWVEPLRPHRQLVVRPLGTSSVKEHGNGTSTRTRREWAQQHLRGIADSLITPFSGEHGDDIDYDAYRALVRYCLGDLDHDGLWLTSGLAEWWALTMDERKTLAEVSVDEARRVKPPAFLQVCTVALNAKDTVELTLHAQEIGADICYLQNPVMEAHGGPGMLEFFKYVADRTGHRAGMFNSPSSGYEMTPAEVALVAEEIPAMCAIKDPATTSGHGIAVSQLIPASSSCGTSVVAQAPCTSPGMSSKVCRVPASSVGWRT